jgi:hypothetical protein
MTGPSWQSGRRGHRRATNSELLAGSVLLAQMTGCWCDRAMSGRPRDLEVATGRAVTPRRQVAQSRTRCGPTAPFAQSVGIQARHTSHDLSNLTALTGGRAKEAWRGFGTAGQGGDGLLRRRSITCRPLGHSPNGNIRPNQTRAMGSRQSACWPPTS